MSVIQRPKSISIVTVIAIVLVLLAFPMLFMPSIKRMGDFIPMILGIIITLQFVSLIGVWHMKRWGVHLFIIMFSIRVITFMFLEMYTFRFYFNIFYSVIFLVFFLIHYRKMDTNL
jgi:membrane-bound ClpP family serine protease